MVLRARNSGLGCPGPRGVPWGHSPGWWLGWTKKTQDSFPPTTDPLGPLNMALPLVTSSMASGGQTQMALHKVLLIS